MLAGLRERYRGFYTFDEVHCGVKLTSELLWVQIVNIHGIDGIRRSIAPSHLSKLVVSRAVGIVAVLV